MQVQLLSGEVFSLREDKCAREQLSTILGVPESRIQLISYEDRLHALVQDHQVEWKESGELVRDTRGYPYRKHYLSINGETRVVYQGSGGYAFGKRFASTTVTEVIFPIREWYTREEIEGKK